MKKLLLIAVVLIAAFQFVQHAGLLRGAAERSPPATNSASTQTAPHVERPNGDGLIAQAFADGRSNVQVQAAGRVTKVLADDDDGSRHQRFIVQLDSGQSLLIAHNIDLAPRIAGLREGDAVGFYGEYEWNNKGGVIHWTHADPRGQHPAGWIRHNGQTYQ